MESFESGKTKNLGNFENNLKKPGILKNKILNKKFSLNFGEI